jgi:hypothetical protein
MSWRKYYVIKQQINGSPANANAVKYIIHYNDDCAQAGHIAYKVKYRTEENAERGAERLYRREHGWLEEALQIK